jgi:hypothetical protein
LVACEVSVGTALIRSAAVESAADRDLSRPAVDVHTGELRNHGRWWDGSLVRALAKQLAKMSFRSYVLGDLRANQVGAVPIIYRLA